VLHFANVRVSADKQVGFVCQEVFANAVIVLAGASANVGHPNPQALHRKTIVQREFSADAVVVNVAVHGTQGSYTGQSVGYGQIADVSGMPDFVAAGEQFQDAVVDVAVCV
jgi:hypothetical protein